MNDSARSVLNWSQDVCTLILVIYPSVELESQRQLNTPGCCGEIPCKGVYPTLKAKRIMNDYDTDAFISSAHMDNVELVEGRRGWVANLHRALEVRVGQLLGKQPHIWRDPKLSG